MNATQARSSDAYVLMSKNPDGSPGLILGIDSLDEENADGAGLLFEELKEAHAVRAKLLDRPLSIFKVHMRVIGEVAA